jgi:type II secretion system protein G
MKKSVKGFTIVELLIVIVIIAVLAAISVVAYTGTQGRARDSERKSELSNIMKALELYRVDNGGYPRCDTDGAYVAGGSLSSGTLHDCVTDELTPDYIASVPRDPVDVAPKRYYYAVGYKKITATTYDSAQTNNYIIGATMDSPAGANTSGWGIVVNNLLGSTN